MGLSFTVWGVTISPPYEMLLGLSDQREWVGHGICMGQKKNVFFCEKLKSSPAYAKCR